MDLLITISQFVLSLSLLIILHECGHFFPARWFNTRVEKFYLFFDPWFSLFKIKRGDTEYGIGWLPLGGYVKISGMIDESMDKEQMKGSVQPWEFRAKPAWQRLIIMLGGVTVNFILGILLFGMIMMVWGEQYLKSSDAKYGIAVTDFGRELGLEDGDQVISVGGKTMEIFAPGLVVKEIVINAADNIQVLREGSTVSLSISNEQALNLASFANKDKDIFNIRLPITVAQVPVGTNASKAGLIKDDRIIGIANIETAYFHEFQRVASENAGATVPLRILRNDSPQEIEIEIGQDGKLGFMPYGYDKYLPIYSEKLSLFPAMVHGYKQSTGFINDQVTAFGQIFKGQRKASESLGSFLSIGSMFGNEWRWRHFWFMTATLSVLLAFVNLLPIPALDGGHVVFLLWEAITGIKPSEKVLEYSTIAGFGLLMALMVYALKLDISRFF